MSIPLWPDDLPCRVRRDGYGETLPDGRLRQKMDAGPAKTRRRTSAAVRPVSASLEVGADAKVRFDRFWAEETAEGSLPFLMRGQVLSGLGLATGDAAPLLTAEGDVLAAEDWWLVMFGEAPPQVARDITGRRYSISFALDILP